MTDCPVCEMEFDDVEAMSNHVVKKHLKFDGYVGGGQSVRCWCGKSLFRDTAGGPGLDLRLHCEREGGIHAHFLRCILRVKGES